VVRVGLTAWSDLDRLTGVVVESGAVGHAVLAAGLAEQGDAVGMSDSAGTLEIRDRVTDYNDGRGVRRST